MDRIPLILDTDIGSDIDDAVALAYLLGQSRCDLLGITTVSGDTRKRAALAKYICDAAGRPDIPIFAGLDLPLGRGPGQPDINQFEAIRGKEPRADYGSADGKDAIRFMKAIFDERPGEVTLLTIGPLTNAAALFRQFPEITDKIGNVMAMVGIYGPRPSGSTDPTLDPVDWNAFVDPLATQIFFESIPAGKLTCMPLNVTLECVLPASECRKRFHEGGPTLKAVGELAEVWFDERDRMAFHDPLAAAAIFKPELCKWEQGSVRIIPEPNEHAGKTVWSPSPDGPVKVATDVDVERFFNEYFETASNAIRR